MYNKEVIVKIPNQLFTDAPALGYRLRSTLQFVPPLMSVVSWIGSARNLHGFIQSLDYELRNGQRKLDTSGSFLGLLRERTNLMLSEIGTAVDTTRQVDLSNDQEGTQEIRLPKGEVFDYSLTHILFYEKPKDVPKHMVFTLLADNFTIPMTMKELVFRLNKKRFPIITELAESTLGQYKGK